MVMQTHMAPCAYPVAWLPITSLAVPVAVDGVACCYARWCLGGGSGCAGISPYGDILVTWPSASRAAIVTVVVTIHWACYIRNTIPYKNWSNRLKRLTSIYLSTRSIPNVLLRMANVNGKIYSPILPKIRKKPARIIMRHRETRRDPIETRYRSVYGSLAS